PLRFPKRLIMSTNHVLLFGRSVRSTAWTVSSSGSSAKNKKPKTTIIKQSRRLLRGITLIEEQNKGAEHATGGANSNLTRIVKRRTGPRVLSLCHRVERLDSIACDWQPLIVLRAPAHEVASRVHLLSVSTVNAKAHFDFWNLFSVD